MHEVSNETTPHTNTRPRAVQVTAARAKAAPLLSATVHLLDKHDVCAIAGVTFPTIWAWMQKGDFPRGRIVGGKSMWLSTEVEAWLTNLPVRKLKHEKTAAAKEMAS
jgi:predicted DNA-binding transcriptional regulator AlpA